MAIYRDLIFDPQRGGRKFGAQTHGAGSKVRPCVKPFHEL